MKANWELMLGHKLDPTNKPKLSIRQSNLARVISESLKVMTSVRMVCAK